MTSGMSSFSCLFSFGTMKSEMTWSTSLPRHECMVCSRFSLWASLLLGSLLLELARMDPKNHFLGHCRNTREPETDHLIFSTSSCAEISDNLEAPSLLPC